MAGYGDDDGFHAWLSESGHAMPVGAPTPSILRQRGSVYIDSVYGSRFLGAPTGGYDQERAWPRTGATAYETDIPTDAVPERVVIASYTAAWYEANNPGGLSVAATAAGAVKREKIDVIETEYFAGSGNAVQDATVTLLDVEGLLAPFFGTLGPAVYVV